MALFQAAIVGLIALIIAPGYFFYFDITPKLVVLLAGTAVAFVFVKPARSWLGVMAAATAASLGVSALFSSNPALSWFGGNWRRFGVVEQVTVLLFAWLVASHTAGDPKRTRTVLRGIAAAALLAGIYGILQYFGIDPLLPAAAYHIGEGIWTIVRPPGTLGYVSYFANWLAMAAFLSLALAQLEERAAFRVAAYAAAAVAAFAMVLTGTRGALLAVAAGSLVLMGSGTVRLNRRILVAAATLAFGFIVFYYSPAGWNLHSRARWFREDPRGGARLELWRDTVAMSVHRLPTGFGPEVFTAQFPHYESKQLAESYPDFAHESPHNMFLDALVAQGFPGMALLIVLCTVAVVRAGSKWLLAAVVTGIVAQQFTCFTIPTAVLFYVAIAITGEPLPDGRGSVGARSNRNRSLLLDRKGALALRLIPAAALLFLAFRVSVADHALDLTRRAINRGDGVSAANSFASFEHWRLPGAGSDLWYSRAMSALAQRTPDRLRRIQIAAQAGYAALRATRTAEDPFNAWYHAAALYATTNDAFYAERSLRFAIAAHPTWFKPHWMLARILALEGRRDDAHREAALAVELDGGKHKEVTDTLQSSLSASLHK